MKTVRLALAMVALLGGYLGGAAAEMSAEEGSQQCWRRVYEPLGTCSACASTCRGAGYLCCEIVVG
jgi:hypothetical protein